MQERKRGIPLCVPRLCYKDTTVYMDRLKISEMVGSHKIPRFRHLERQAYDRLGSAGLQRPRSKKKKNAPLGDDWTITAQRRNSS